METYKKEFVDFMLESNVLKFGDFTLKSGRKSPKYMPMKKNYNKKNQKRKKG